MISEELRIGGRPGSTGILKRISMLTGNSNKTGTYHHVIPFKTLKEYWNGMRDNESLYTFMEMLVNHHFKKRGNNGLDEGPITGDMGTYDEDALLKAIKYHKDPSGKNGETGSVDESILRDQLDVIKAIFVWMPGNLVIGPQNRAKDPSDKYDDYVSRLMRVEHSENVHLIYNSIRSLYDNAGMRRIIEVLADEAVTRDDARWEYKPAERVYHIVD